MTRFYARVLLRALPCLSLLVAMSVATAEDDRFTTKEKSLLRVAERPSKSVVKSGTKTSNKSTKQSNGKAATKPTNTQSKRTKNTPTQQTEAKAKSNSDATPEPKSEDAKTVDLRYKLERGDVLRYDVSHKASIRSTIDETTQSAQTRTESVKAWKVTDVLPEGDIEFTNVVEKVHMVNQLPEHDATEYDSTRDKIAPPGFEDAAKAVGVPLSVMRITPQGKVVRRDLKVRNQGAEDDAPIVLRLPENKVAIGDTWDEPFDVQVKIKDNGTKMIQTRRHHKLSDVKNGVATIDVTYQVLSPVDAYIETQIVQKLMEGQVHFDIENGHVLNQEMQVDKRVIGFAGPTSSMQYVMKMEEKLIKDESKTAATKPKSSAVANGNSAKNQSSATTATNSKSQRSSTPQTATRQRTTQPSGKTIRR